VTLRVLVTGAGGFIGSHLVDALLDAGHDVRALVRYTSGGRWGNLEHHRGTGAVDVRLGDVRDRGLVDAASSSCDVVLHLAALIGIPYSYDAPASYVDTNVTGTLHVLEAARRQGLSRVVVTSTSEVYGSATTVPMTEAHRLHAQSPYAATKIAADQLALSYRRAFDVPVLVMRPFNTYGPRQSARAILPTILGQLLGGAHALRLGNIEPRRDLTFVSDTVRAFVLAATADVGDVEVVHFGSGTAVSVGELAQLGMDAAGRVVPIEVDDGRLRPPASEVDLLLADASLARSVLGWTPKVTLEEGIRATLEDIRRAPERYGSSGYAT
jgi:NAD dependent epimerase/dehydratase